MRTFARLLESQRSFSSAVKRLADAVESARRGGAYLRGELSVPGNGEDMDWFRELSLDSRIERIEKELRSFGAISCQAKKAGTGWSGTVARYAVIRWWAIFQETPEQLRERLTSELVSFREDADEIKNWDRAWTSKATREAQQAERRAEVFTLARARGALISSQEEDRAFIGPAGFGQWTSTILEDTDWSNPTAASTKLVQASEAAVAEKTAKEELASRQTAWRSNALAELRAILENHEVVVHEDDGIPAIYERAGRAKPTFSEDFLQNWALGLGSTEHFGDPNAVATKVLTRCGVKALGLGENFPSYPE